FDAGNETLFLKRDDDDTGADAFDQPRLLEEVIDAFLQADRIDDALALQTLQARLDDLELRAIDHDRHVGEGRLVGEEMEKARHRLFAVDEVGVHVDVEDVGAAFDLLASDLDGLVEVAVLDEAFELERAGDVAALADHDEVGFRPDGEDFVAGEARIAR